MALIKPEQIAPLPASQIAYGEFDDGRISESSVIQHQGALSIGADQITNLASGYLQRVGSWGNGNDAMILGVTPATMPLSEQLINNSDYSASNGVLTVNTGGLHTVTAHINFTSIQ